MLPGVLAIEQDGYALLRGRRGFFLRDLPPGGERNAEVWSEPKRPDRTSSQKCGKLVKEETKGEKR